MTTAVNQDLRAALDRLTLCLETPCLPGEVEEWARPVCEALSALGETVRRQITTDHRDQDAAITEQDAEMFRDVEKLKQQDRKLLDEFESLARRCQALVVKAPQIEPDELKVHDDVAAVLHQGLEFVLACQQQEIAIRNWFQEAFTRDRGVID